MQHATGVCLCVMLAAPFIIYFSHCYQRAGYKMSLAHPPSFQHGTIGSFPK